MRKMQSSMFLQNETIFWGSGSEHASKTHINNNNDNDNNKYIYINRNQKSGQIYHLQNEIYSLRFLLHKSHVVGINVYFHLLILYVFWKYPRFTVCLKKGCLDPLG